MATAASSPAPWRESFLSHIKTMQSPEFVLSTLHLVGDASQSSPSASQFTPRARTVIFRGLWACLPVNPKNTAELNPDVYESDLPTITTDSRMDKVPELLGSASSAAANSQSGAGGPVEAVFWAAEPHTQWRIRGRAYLIGPDIDSPSADPVRAALETHMRSTSSSEAASRGSHSWSWSRELTAHFGNLSPGMRGSFRNPPPGTPLSETPAQGLGLGQKVEGLHDEVARANFRVLVVVPEEVDRVDLTDPDRGRRWNYKLMGSDCTATWKVTELWP